MKKGKIMKTIITGAAMMFAACGGQKETAENTVIKVGDLHLLQVHLQFME